MDSLAGATVGCYNGSECAASLYSALKNDLATIFRPKGARGGGHGCLVDLTGAKEIVAVRLAVRSTAFRFWNYSCRPRCRGHRGWIEANPPLVTNNGRREPQLEHAVLTSLPDTLARSDLIEQGPANTASEVEDQRATYVEELTALERNISKNEDTVFEKAP
ncbi:hypothetical protein [Amycolatopsis sp. NPDC054798]